MAADQRPATLLPPKEPGLAGLIRDHNRLNGFVFSAIEFGLVATLLGGFAIAYLVQSQWIPAVVAGGIAVNCLPTVVLAVRAKVTDETQVGWRALRESPHQLRLERPHMLAGTLTIVGLTLVPFAGVTVLVVQRVTGSKSAGTH